MRVVELSFLFVPAQVSNPSVLQYLLTGLGNPACARALVCVPSGRCLLKPRLVAASGFFVASKERRPLSRPRGPGSFLTEFSSSSISHEATDKDRDHDAEQQGERAHLQWGEQCGQTNGGQDSADDHPPRLIARQQTRGRGVPQVPGASRLPDRVAALTSGSASCLSARRHLGSAVDSGIAGTSKIVRDGEVDLAKFREPFALRGERGQAAKSAQVEERGMRFAHEAERAAKRYVRV